MTVSFNKTYSTPEEILKILRERGLEITDDSKTLHYIKHIGYYRLSAYFHPLLAEPKENHSFKPDSTFSNALSLYRFDKKLRLFLFNELEKVEVAFRSAIANIVAEETNNIFWMTTPEIYANSDKFNSTISLINKELSRTKEEFIIHFKEKYSNDYPPAWMLVEILPLGVVTRIYENIANHALRKKVAARFNLPIPLFTSWITIITLTRNSCCHHARVWNRNFPIMPQLNGSFRGDWIVNMDFPMVKLYPQLCYLEYMQNQILGTG